MARLAALSAVGGALSLCACVTTSMQGYADRELPAQPVTHVAALVRAPLPLDRGVERGRSLWVGTGQVSAGGALFVGNDTSATNAAASIFADMQAKGGHRGGAELTLSTA